MLACPLPDEDLAQLVARFNALRQLWCRTEFQPRKANKPHEDAFGIPIRDGETYYWEHECGNERNGIKLARSSMQALCETILCPSPKLRTLADKLIERAWQRCCEAMERAIDDPL